MARRRSLALLVVVLLLLLVGTRVRRGGERVQAVASTVVRARIPLGRPVVRHSPGSLP